MRRVIQFAIATALLAAALPGSAQVTPSEPTHRISSPISFYDDADITARGTISVSEDVEYGRVQAGKDLSFPSSYVSLGLHKRLEVSAGIGYTRSQFETLRVSGLADTYVGGKILLLGEGLRRPAIAVKPTLEILGAPSMQNNLLAPGRVNFMAPVILQKTFDKFRVYAGAGYLTRGLFFQSAAFELNRWSRVTPSVIIMHSQLTRELGTVSDLGLNRSRSDALGSLAVNVLPHWSVFGSAGRSFGRRDVNSATYQFAAGFSVNFRLWE